MGHGLNETRLVREMRRQGDVGGDESGRRRHGQRMAVVKGGVDGAMLTVSRHSQGRTATQGP